MSCSLKNCPAHVLNAGLGALSYFPLSLWSWQDTVKPVFLDNILQVPSATHTATVTQNPATSLHKGEISEQATNSSIY